MSKRATTTIKSVNDPNYQTFQSLARAARESNRRKRQQLNKAATQIQRKVRQTQKKKKKKAATQIQRKVRQTRRRRQKKFKKKTSAATRIANAARRSSAITKKYNLRLEKNVREFIQDIRNTNAAKKFYSKLGEYDKERFEGCLRNCIRNFSDVQKYYNEPGSRFSRPMGQLSRQVSNEDRVLLTTDLLRQLSGDSYFNDSEYSPSVMSYEYPSAAAAATAPRIAPKLMSQSSLDLLYPGALRGSSPFFAKRKPSRFIRPSPKSAAPRYTDSIDSFGSFSSEDWSNNSSSESVDSQKKTSKKGKKSKGGKRKRTRKRIS
tara:strand:- start:124 stop:1080 length:957 start_codon:yes stop_codon:yes gene_type:complete